MPGTGGMLGSGAGGQDELVVGERRRSRPSTRFLQRDRVRRCGRWRRASVSVRARDALGLHEELGIAHHAGRGAEQLVAVVEEPADVVGIAAGGHRQVGVLLDDRDLRVLIHAPGLGGGLGPGRAPPITTILLLAYQAILLAP